jgi:hypothetical protein
MGLGEVDTDAEIRALREQLSAARAERTRLDRKASAAGSLPAALAAARRDADALTSPAVNAARDRAATLRARLAEQWRTADELRRKHAHMRLAATDPTVPLALILPDLDALETALADEAAVRVQVADRLAADAPASTLRPPAAAPTRLHPAGGAS